MLEHRGHRDGVEATGAGRHILRERTGQQPVALAGERTHESGVEAQPLAQGVTERPEQGTVVAPDVENPCAGRDAPHDLVKPTVSEVAVEVLHITSIPADWAGVAG